LKAKAVRAQWIAQGLPTATPNSGPEPGEWSFDDLLLAYLREVTPSKKAPERDKYSAKNLYRHLTGRRLSDIGASVAREYIASRVTAGASPGTINKEISLASAAWTWGQRELELSIVNPWRSRRQREPHGRKRFLTHEEAERLLSAARAAPGRAGAYLPEWITVCLFTGLRPGEALALSWAQVDLGKGLIQFAPDQQKGARHSLVPINARARAALIARARFRAEHCPDSPWVFCRRDGSRIASVKKGFADCVRRAGLEGLHPHDLRRTCGSWLIQAGEDIARVSAILRHSSVDVTAGVYAHLRPSDLQQSAAALDRIGAATSQSDFTVGDAPAADAG
jgi:integrase